MNTPVTIEIERVLIKKGIAMPVKTTIAEVVMWLYEKHGIWISVTKDISVNWANEYFDYYILRHNKSTGSNIGGTQPTSPTEAYLSAITHVLNNLL